MDIIQKYKIIRRIIWISVLGFLDIAMNIILCYVIQGQIQMSDNGISIFYFFIPIIETILFVSICGYLMGCYSIIAEKFSYPRCKRVLYIIVVVFLFLAWCMAGIITQSELLTSLIFSRVVPGFVDYQLIIDGWVSIYGIGCFIVFVMLIVSAVRCYQLAGQMRRLHVKEQQKQEQMRRQKAFVEARKQELDSIKLDLGMEYTDSEFYRQTQLQYFDLNHKSGTKGEFELYKNLKKAHINGLYYVFNREIPKDDGLNTEIDLILIHKNGIFVLENKDYNTNVFGEGSAYDLTIIDRTGRKISVYNPIRQNERHVQALKAYLQKLGIFIDQICTPIHSIVVFTDMRTHKSDSIIANIDMQNTHSKLCTSQNVADVVYSIIIQNPGRVALNATEVTKVLESLPVRIKT